jgi:hypothetical protein
MKSKPPAQVKINLLPKDPFYDSLVGRVLKWALSAGRYVVIFTELVVIVSFATRFILDQSLTNLNNEIVQKESIIRSYGDLEVNFRTAQAKIAKIKELNQDANITEVYPYISEITPDGINMSELIIKPDGIIAAGSTLSQTTFNIFVSNLELSPHFLNISIDTVESRDQDEPGFIFALSADTKEVKTVVAPTEVEKIDLLDRTQGL